MVPMFYRYCRESLALGIRPTTYTQQRSQPQQPIQGSLLRIHTYRSRSGRFQFSVFSFRKLGLYPADPEIRIDSTPATHRHYRQTQALLAPPPLSALQSRPRKETLTNSISSLCSGLWASRPNPAHSLAARLLSAFWAVEA